MGLDKHRRFDMSKYMDNHIPHAILASAFQATDVLGWLFTLGLAGSVWQGIKHAQRAYRAQDKQDKLEEAAWAIGIPAISAGVYWFSIRIGIINPVWTLGSLPAW
jgi:hypothetical protein